MNMKYQSLARKRIGILTGTVTTLLVGLLSMVPSALAIPSQGAPIYNIVITEILYHAASNEMTEETQFIEIYNAEDFPINLENWELDDEDPDGPNVLPDVTIQPGEVLVLTGSSVEDFEGAFGGGIKVVSLPNMINLANGPTLSSEILTLSDEFDQTVDVVNYDDDDLWPDDGFGGGFSIYLTVDPSSPGATSANDDGSNWAASVVGVDDAYASTPFGVWDLSEIASPGFVPVEEPPQTITVEFTGAQTSGDESVAEPEIIQVTTSDGNPTGEPIEVIVTIDGGSTAGGEDFNIPVAPISESEMGTNAVLGSYQITIPADTTSGSTVPVGLTIVDDQLDELDETLLLSLSDPQVLVFSGVSVNVIGAQNTTTYTIQDNDEPPQDITVSFPAPATSGAESLADPPLLVVTTSDGNPTDEAVTVTVNVSESSTATLGVDFTVPTQPLEDFTTQTSIFIASYTVEIPAATNDGATLSAGLTVVDDNVVEPDEVIELVLTGDDVAGGANTDYTIQDNDTASVTIEDVTQAEGDSGDTTFTFTATLDNAVQGGFTVDWATADGTATASEDYVAVTDGQLAFAGTVSETQTFDVTVNGDTVVESDETFTVSLSNVSNADVDITDMATGTITNDDQNVTVEFTGAATSGDESVQNPPIISVTTSDGQPTASSAEVTVTVTGGTATLNEDYTVDTSGEMVTLSVNPLALIDVVIPADTGSGTVLALTDLSVIDDTLDEPDETIAFALSQPNGVVIGDTMMTSYTIQDNDTPPAMVTLTNLDAEAAEPGGAGNRGSFLFNNSGSSVVSVDVTISGTATVTDDYLFNFAGAVVNGSTVTLPLAPGDNTVFVDPVDDATDEGDETIVLTLAAGTGYTVGTPATGNVTIADDDSSQQCPVMTVGIYRDSTFRWYLRYENTSGFADAVFGFGLPTDVAVVGDWDGDGDDTVGIYRNNTFYLVNSNGATQAEIVVPFGAAGDIPVVGDWNGDGTDTIGIYRPSTAAWALRNSNTPGAPDLNFGYGLTNEIPVVGDWDGDGTDTVGIYRVSDRRFFLRNSNDSGNADLRFIYGNPAEDIPIVGDWDGNCTDTIGVYREGGARWLLRNTNDAGTADIAFTYGLANETPVVGAWDQNVVTSSFITAMLSMDEVSVQGATVAEAPADTPADLPAEDAPAASLPALAAPDALSAMGAWTLADAGWTVSGGETAALTWTQPVDLGAATAPTLSFSSDLSAVSATAAVQVQPDGGDWTTIGVVSADESAPSFDLSSYAGETVSVRFVWIGGADVGDTWTVSGVIVADSAPADDIVEDTPSDDSLGNIEPMAPMSGE